MKNKQLFTKIILLLVVICFGIFNGGHQLEKKAEAVENIFLEGENQDGLSIHYDLTKIDDSLSYFLSLAKIYEVKSESISSLQNLHKQYQNIEEIKDYSTWYKEVKKVYPIAIEEVREKELTSQHAGMLKRYESTYTSAIHTISYSPFNTYVEEYEEETEGLLASFMKSFAKVEGVDRFD